MNNHEPIDKTIERRNACLLRLFTSNGYDVRLIGDLQKPSIILNDILVLSCHVRNFDLHFTKEAYGDDIVKSFKLTNDVEVTQLELQEAIELCAHRPVYKIKHSPTNLFLVGFNVFDKDTTLGRYPVFAKHKPKVYFDREYADKVIAGLRSENYILELA